jgi:hypothetical protein
MRSLKTSGRIAIAESIMARPLHIAWGAGDGSWTTPPAPPTGQLALLAEVGRHTATVASFVVADAAGAIVTPTGRYTLSATPTSSIYILANFEAANAPSAIIREVAVFVGSEPLTGLPIGQTYFEPAELQSAGRMLEFENVAPIYRSPVANESFAFVITF